MQFNPCGLQSTNLGSFNPGSTPPTDGRNRSLTLDEEYLYFRESNNFPQFSETSGSNQTLGRFTPCSPKSYEARTPNTIEKLISYIQEKINFLENPDVRKNMLLTISTFQLHQIALENIFPDDSPSKLHELLINEKPNAEEIIQLKLLLTQWKMQIESFRAPTPSAYPFPPHSHSFSSSNI